jgi:mannose-6-phosphate isomerase-like protein (cupin superfamily)
VTWRLVLETGRPYTNPRSGGTLTLLTHWEETDGDLLEVERSLPPGTGKLPPHVHLDFRQTFTVVEGRAVGALGRKKLALSAAETLDVPQGAPHRDPWNPGPDRGVLRIRITPVPELIRAYLETMVARAVEGKLNRRDELPFLQIAVLLQEKNGQSFDSRFPIGLQRMAVPLLGALARLLGYRTA